ncbi:hypothetical protein [Streptomyces sp. NPDC058622]|uniref:hypothetical protein n=1 Tax=Streptomyces sp. NPDC058622 TaxID=3346562 RepID=UPI00366126DA
MEPDGRDGLAGRADALTAGLRADPERLAAIPSVAFPGYPAEPVQEAYDLVVSLLREAGVPRSSASTCPTPRR